MVEGLITKSRVRNAIGVTMAAVGAYLIYRPVSHFRADQKAYEVAAKAVDPENIAQWRYHEAVRAFRADYIDGNIEYVDMGPLWDSSWELVPTLRLPFKMFWDSLKSDDIAFLKDAAERAGSTLEEAHDHILWGSMEFVPSPLPSAPSAMRYRQWCLLQLALPAGIAVGAQYFLKEKKR